MSKIDLTYEGSFPNAFRAARKRRFSEFTWRGKLFTTKLAHEAQSSASFTSQNDSAMGAPEKSVHRLIYDQGPIGYLMSAVRKEMAKAHYPVKIHTIYRSPDLQAKLKARGYSKAGPYDGAHQYFAAGDLIHEKYAWFARKYPSGKPTGFPDGKNFWNTLWDCAAVVSEKYSVPFEPRLSWDPAHIEVDKTIWHRWRLNIGRRPPTSSDLEEMWVDLLPKQWNAHKKAQLDRKT